MARYQIKIVYDGTLFEGYQRQKKSRVGDRTVQATLEEALRQLGWQGWAILSAGRTDRGVHASGQIATFDLEWGHSPEALLAAINAHLPADVAVSEIAMARADFHPRYAAWSRRYQYRIYCAPIRDPLRDRYAWRVWPPVSLEPLQDLADKLVGAHDFGAFGTPPRRAGSTIREVYRAKWQTERDELCFEIVANAFLYHMVRRLVFAQVASAQGKLTMDEFEACLISGAQNVVHGLAPAQGLVLVEVNYDQYSVQGEDYVPRSGDKCGEDLHPKS